MPPVIPEVKRRDQCFAGAGGRDDEILPEAKGPLGLEFLENLFLMLIGLNIKLHTELQWFPF